MYILKSFCTLLFVVVEVVMMVVIVFPRGKILRSNAIIYMGKRLHCSVDTVYSLLEANFPLP